MMLTWKHVVLIIAWMLALVAAGVIDKANAETKYNWLPEDISESWILIEVTLLGVKAHRFHTEYGCFVSGIIASHQQGVEAQCQYAPKSAKAE